MLRYSLVLLTLTLALSHCAKPQQRPAVGGAKPGQGNDVKPASGNDVKPAPGNDVKPSGGKPDGTTNDGSNPKSNDGKEPTEDENEDPAGPGSGPGPETADPAAPTKEFGALNEPLSTSGFISGYAGVQGKADEYLTVKFYLDGDNKTGKALGEIRANLVAFDDGLDGDHGFIYDLPQDALDGRIHKLHIFVVWNGKEYPISEKKPIYDVRGFTPKGERVATAFAKTGFMVNGRVNPSCRGCHGGFSYQDRWTRLTEASPDTNEWTAEKNYLITKLRRGHIDTRRIAPCSVIKCDEVVNWWKQEFGEP